MIRLIKRLLEIKFIRFILVGGLNTLFGVGVYSLLIYLGLEYKVAVLISTVLGVIFNYKTIGTLVFKDKRNNFSLIAKFVISYTIAYFINIGLIYLFKSYLELNDYYAGIAATPFVAIFSFLLQKRFVFTKKRESQS